MDPDKKPTIWQYARRKFMHCHCLCVLMTSMPIVRSNHVSYMALCPECNERKFIETTTDQVDLDFLYLKVGER